MASGDETDAPADAPKPAATAEPIIDPHAPPDAQALADLADIPRIPYSRGLKLSGSELMRIAMTIGLLVMLLVMQQPCATAVSKFVAGFDAENAVPPNTISRPRAPAPTAGSGQYVRLKPGMTDAEMKATLDKARAGSGSAGSATP